MFILVMCILFQRISNTCDFAETHQRENKPLIKRINSSNTTVAWKDN